MISFKLKDVCSPKLFRKLQYRPQVGRKYLQITYLIKDLFSEYLKNFQNLSNI